MSRLRTLSIASTWDGRPLSADEKSVIELGVGEEQWIINVDAPFHDDSAPPAPSASFDGLWEYEVVELFVAGRRHRYLEIELGPHGHYLALAFRDVRRRDGAPLPLTFRSEIRGERWTGLATVPTSYLPQGPHRVAAFAIHGARPRRYLANTPLPGAAPDFHQPHLFRSFG